MQATAVLKGHRAALLKGDLPAARPATVGLFTPLTLSTYNLQVDAPPSSNAIAAAVPDLRPSESGKRSLFGAMRARPSGIAGMDAHKRHELPTALCISKYMQIFMLLHKAYLCDG